MAESEQPAEEAEEPQEGAEQADEVVGELEEKAAEEQDEAEDQALPAHIQENVDILTAYEDTDLLATLKAALENRAAVLQALVDWAVPDRTYVSARLLMNNRVCGKIRSFNEASGYGFIDCHAVHDAFGNDAFLHHQQLNSFTVGQEVSFAILLSKDGKPQAFDLGPAKDGTDMRKLERIHGTRGGVSTRGSGSKGHHDGGRGGHRAPLDGHRGSPDGYRGHPDGHRHPPDGYRGSPDGFRGPSDVYRGPPDGYRGSPGGFPGGWGWGMPPPGPPHGPWLGPGWGGPPLHPPPPPMPLRMGMGRERPVPLDGRLRRSVSRRRLPGARLAGPRLRDPMSKRDAPPSSSSAPGDTGQRFEGVIKSVNERFGFIDNSELKARYGNDVFVRHGEMGNFRMGEAVSFTLILTRDEKPQAKDIRAAHGGPGHDDRRGSRPPPQAGRPVKRPRV